MRARVLGGFFVVLIAACGVSTTTYADNHSAEQILADASASTAKANSFHIAIDEAAPSGPATAEMDVENGNFSGKVASQGITARIMRVSGQAFVYGSDLAAVLAPTNAQAAAMVSSRASDKWVRVPSDIWGSSFDQLLDVKTLSQCLKSMPGAVKKGTSVKSGQQVVELDDQTDSQVFVQTAAPHRFIQMVFSGVDSCATDSTAANQTIVLSQYGAAFHIAMPAGYVDISTLESGG